MPRTWSAAAARRTIVTAAGLNIYPEDLEAALLWQPHRAAAVVAAGKPQPSAALVMRGMERQGDEAVRAANRSGRPTNPALGDMAELICRDLGESPAEGSRGALRCRRGERKRQASDWRLGEHDRADHGRRHVRLAGSRTASACN